MAGRLIELVKKYPILYDTKHEDYRNTPKREETWEEIGYELGEDGDVMKSKWKNIRDSYAKYLKDLRVKSGAKKSYKNWKWAAEMKYFRPYLAFARNIDTLMNEYDDEDDTDHADQISEPEMSLEDISNSDSIDVKTISTSLSPEPSSSRTSTRQKRKQNTENTNGWASNESDYLQNKRKHFEDPIDLIFRGYAQCAKQFSPERQAYTKLQIAKIMAQQELEHLQEQELNKRSS